MIFKINPFYKLRFKKGETGLYLNKKLLKDVSDDKLKSIHVSVELINEVLKKLMTLVLKTSIIGEGELGARFLKNCDIVDSFDNKKHWNTLGVHFFLKKLSINKKTIKAQIWNINTAEKFHFLSPTILKGTFLGIFIFNLETQESFYLLNQYLEKSLEVFNKKRKHTIIILINKDSKIEISDLIEKYEIFRIIKFTKDNEFNLEKFLNQFLVKVLDDLYTSWGGVNNEVHINDLVELKQFILKFEKVASSYFHTESTADLT